VVLLGPPDDRVVEDAAPDVPLVADVDLAPVVDEELPHVRVAEGPQSNPDTPSVWNDVLENGRLHGAPFQVACHGHGPVTSYRWMLGL
jgi:hypothetical protein